MLVDVYSTDKDVMGVLEAQRDPRDRVRQIKAFPLSRQDATTLAQTLAIIDARAAMTRDRPFLPPRLADIGAASLFLVKSSSDMLNIQEEIRSQGVRTDFLIWPATLPVLSTRLNLYRHYLSASGRMMQRLGPRREGRFWSATELLPVMIVAGDDSGGIIFQNAALRRFGGPLFEERQEGFSWLENVHHEDRLNVVSVMAEGIAKKQIFQVTARLRRSDGAWRWVTITGRSYDDPDGSYAGMVSSLEDITDQRRADDRLHESAAMFRELANSVPLIIWQCTPDGAISFCNESWETYVAPLEAEKLADVAKRLLHEDDRIAVCAQWEHAWKTGASGTMEGRLWEERSGVYRWHRIVLMPIRDATGAIRRWTGSAMDIDRERRRADEIKFLYRQLEELSRAKDDFLAAVSHELRTPLNVILGYCQLLLELRPHDAPLSGLLEGIMHHANEIMILIEKLPWPPRYTPNVLQGEG